MWVKVFAHRCRRRGRRQSRTMQTTDYMGDFSLLLGLAGLAVEWPHCVGLQCRTGYPGPVVVWACCQMWSRPVLLWFHPRSRCFVRSTPPLKSIESARRIVAESASRKNRRLKVLFGFQLMGVELEGFRRSDDRLVPLAMTYRLMYRRRSRTSWDAQGFFR
jgi:hypothetical protein